MKTKLFLLLAIIFSFGATHGADVIGPVQDAMQRPYTGKYRQAYFHPLSGKQNIDDVVIWPVDVTVNVTTNGNFRATNMVGGIYFFGYVREDDNGGYRNALRILVPPNSTNTYTLAECAMLATNIGTFVWTNGLPTAVVSITNYVVTNYVWTTNITVTTNALTVTYQTNYAWVYYQAYTNTTLLTNTVNITNQYTLTNGIGGITTSNSASVTFTGDGTSTNPLVATLTSNAPIISVATALTNVTFSPGGISTPSGNQGTFTVYENSYTWTNGGVVWLATNFFSHAVEIADVPFDKNFFKAYANGVFSHWNFQTGYGDTKTTFTSDGGDSVTPPKTGWFDTWYDPAPQTLEYSSDAASTDHLIDLGATALKLSGFIGSGTGLTFNNSNGSKFRLIVNSNTNGFTFVPVP